MSRSRNRQHMTDSLKRRLDTLIVLCSALLGLAMTFLLFWERISIWFVVYALVPTAVIALIVFLYVGN